MKDVLIGSSRTMGKVIVETNRLILREFERSDCQELSIMLANSNVMNFSLNGCLTVAQTQEKIEGFIDSYNQYRFGKWGIVLKHQKQLIGYCGIAIEKIDGEEETELGYRLSHNYWGKGLATEAAKAALEYGLNELNLPYIIAVIDPANIASIRVIEKLGMEYKKQTIFHGLDMNVYQI
jgi:RimJ/RimL family protein N-acetyltransferase